MEVVTIEPDLNTTRTVRALPNARLVLLFAVVLLAIASLYLALTRIYQVDECDSLYVARILAKGRAHAFQTGLTLYHLPLMLLAGPAMHATLLFTAARIFGVMLFWLNLALLAAATGVRLRSTRGLVVLFAAATLAPMWDYGFEVRHDNLLLTGFLVMWCLLRRNQPRERTFFCVGAISVVLEFVALKAFIYALPIALCGAAIAQNGETRKRFLAAWLAGAAFAFATLATLYAAAGLWRIFVRDFSGLAAVAEHAVRFWPWGTLARLALEAPLLVVAVCLGFSRFLGRGRGGDDLRRQAWPEATLAIGSLAALMINPTPFPYNLVNFVPFLFLFAWRDLSSRWESSASRTFRVPVTAVAMLAVAHLVPFSMATLRHFSMRNDRQQTVMRAAEALTDPERDAVYDGIGMVPTRWSSNRRWLLHSLNIASFIEPGDVSVHAMLRANPPAVLIQSYRTDWLTAEDHQFIHDWYLPLSDDLWVLGTIVGRGSDFEIHHAGRYRVLVATSLLDYRNQDRISHPFGDSDGAGATGTSVDAQMVKDGIVRLDEGRHTLTSSATATVALVWIGPTLMKLPVLEPGNHGSLFVNWY